ncbi:hypothetical protein AV530_003708 [Patagioenas fasciata monilis]|uniref:Uncharacterized protein n=1 Tax=Patagioenas fasciata monilis TaxID=372326 RepID=A0A1V4KYK0_PATFA|nr:hypothetical protein AV530_003708 [Patagioenas fasciata monilis]
MAARGAGPRDVRLWREGGKERVRRDPGSHSDDATCSDGSRRGGRTKGAPREPAPSGPERIAKMLWNS